MPYTEWDILTSDTIVYIPKRQRCKDKISQPCDHVRKLARSTNLSSTNKNNVSLEKEIGLRFP